MSAPEVTYDPVLRVVRIGETTYPNPHAAIKALAAYGVTSTEATDMVRAAQATATTAEVA